MSAAWSNAVICVLTDNAFFADLSRAVTNDDNPDGAARWLLSLVSDHLRKHGQNDGPIAAFDFASWDIEAIVAIWPAFHESARVHDAAQVLPALARFLCERLSAVWSVTPAQFAPVTTVVRLADRIDTLVGMFAIGLKPNGSKDPFALRRTAKEALGMIVFPITAPGSKIPAAQAA